MTPRSQDRRIVDDAVDAYVDWREECGAVREAYRAGTVSSSGDAVLALGAYESALDREEYAATVYAALLARVGRLLKTDLARSTDHDAGSLDLDELARATARTASR
jgi:hypothetical protein